MVCVKPSIKSYLILKRMVHRIKDSLNNDPFFATNFSIP